MMTPPSHWNSRGPAAIALLPLSALWGLASWWRRASARPLRASIPVICVGNLSVGGTGKTPIVAWLYEQLTERGWHPAILTRGYGGKLAGPLWVDGSIHDAAACGDEPLMLADGVLGEGRNVMVARDRKAGAKAITASGKFDLIIMDDGLQNPHLYKDVSIGVFDGSAGAGNGWLIPAGPLRTRLRHGMKMLDMIVVNGADETGLNALIPPDIASFEARLRPDIMVGEQLAGKSLLAFAGIGRPARFFDSVEAAGGVIVHQLAFADHHPYSQHDLTRLQEDAQRLGADLITTQKDWVRLPAEWRSQIAVLPVSLELDDNDRMLAMLEAYLAAASDNREAGAG